MSNVISVVDNMPPERHIRQMLKGEVGYTVSWAYDGDNLDEEFTIMSKGGTASLRVECIEPGQYSLTFETPSYRPVTVMQEGEKDDAGASEV